MPPLVTTVPPNPTFTNAFWTQKLGGNILLLTNLQANRRVAAAQQQFRPVWSRSAAGQDAAEAQRDRFWVQVCPKGEAVPTTTNKQQLLLIWQKDTTVIM